MDDIDDIPESLLMEVLLRLPLVALYRFKVVCKKWLSLTSSPYFLRKYAARESISPRWALVSRMAYNCSKRYPVQAHELLIDLHCGDLKCPISNGSNEDKSYRIMGVSNGMVLYQWSMDNSRNHEHRTNWGVCNPVTRQCVVLPPGINEHHWLDDCGFLTQMKDGIVTSYTVVKYVATLKIFEVFFSETGEWKAYVHLYIRHIGLYPAPTDLDGILHWMHSFQGIFAYDPHRKPDALRNIPLPTDTDNRMWKKGKFGMCGTHNGHLRYLESAALSLSVWVLNDYGCGDNWLLQHRVSYTNILKDVHHQCKTMKYKIKLHPVSFHPFDPDIVYLGCDHVFVSYNMRERKSQVLKTFRAIRNGRRDYKWGRAFCLVIPPLPLSPLPSLSPRE